MLAGESLVWLDSRGNLTGLRVVPGEEDPPSNAAQPPDWAALFSAAGIDPAKCTPADPDRMSLPYADARAAWTGMLPDRPGLAMRIDAAAYRGRPVSWRLTVPPWDQDDPATGAIVASASKGLSFQGGPNIFWFAMLLACLVGSALFARRNLRMGRGDRRGAARLAWLVFGLAAVAWVFGEHHTLALGQFSLFTKFAGDALLVAGWLWLTYVAAEPFVRRRWPDALVVWNRLLAGRVRDPLVGRDLLVGCVMGVVWALLNRVLTLLTPVQPNEGIFLRTLYLLSGPHALVAGLSGLVSSCILWCLGTLVLFLSLRALLRSTRLAAVAQVIIVTAVFAIEEVPSPLIWSLDAAIVGSGVFTLVRYGLVAFVAQLIFANLLLGFPVSTQLSAWHFGIGLTGLGLLLAMALYGFYTSLGGQPLFGRATLEE